MKVYFQMLCACNLHFPQEHQRVFPILPLSSFKPDDYFPGQLSRLDMIFRIRNLRALLFFEYNDVNDQKEINNFLF